MTGAKMLAVILAGGVMLMAGSTANVNGNTFGDPKAPVTIEVFSDFQCPGCKAFHDNDLPKIMKDYVVTGKVYLIYRYFPLQGHPSGRICAEYACAAARVGRYQKVAEALFAEQSTIGYINGVLDRVPNPAKVQAVVDAVLTPAEAAKVQSLLKSPEVQHEIETDLAEGQSVPVASTPTIWVTAHGKSQAVSWPLDYSFFKQYIDALVAK